LAAQTPPDRPAGRARPILRGPRAAVLRRRPVRANGGCAEESRPNPCRVGAGAHGVPAGSAGQPAQHADRPRPPTSPATA